MAGDADPSVVLVMVCRRCGHDQSEHRGYSLACERCDCVIYPDAPATSPSDGDETT